MTSVALLTVASGCKNGFFDPTETGRFEKKPLVVNILNHLDTGYEEADPTFRTSTALRPEDLQASNTDYALGRNDLVSIGVTDLVQQNVETTINKRIGETGMISLPLIGQVQAAGLSEAQLENSISQAYRDKGQIRDATVTVTVLEARNRTFSILGAVTQAGQYQILQSDFRLLDALVVARDVNSTGIEYAYIIRHLDQSGTNAPMAPSNAGPTSQPNNDLLNPKSQANGSIEPLSMQADPMLTPATMPAAPMTPMAADDTSMTKSTTMPATTPPGDQEGRIITIEGRPVSTDQPAMPMTAATPSTMPMSETSAASSSTDPFEFNPPPMPTDVRVIRVPLQKLRDGDLRYNLVIRPQDLVFVPNPTIGEYYMGGHVTHSGVYSLTARKITLTQALISAGGYDQLAIPWRTQVIRRLPGQDKEIITMVDLAKIGSGEDPDIYLKPDDQVQVGTSFYAPFLSALRNGFRVTYGFGFLYDRNYAPNNNQN